MPTPRWRVRDRPPEVPPSLAGFLDTGNGFRHGLPGEIGRMELCLTIAFPHAARQGMELRHD